LQRLVDDLQQENDLLRSSVNNEDEEKASQFDIYCCYIRFPSFWFIFFHSLAVLYCSTTYHSSLELTSKSSLHL
jgi:hypothetical protein